MQPLLFLISSLLRRAELFSKEKPVLSLLFFVLILFFGPPILGGAHVAISNYPYVENLTNMSAAYSSLLNTGDSVLLFLIILLLIFLTTLKVSLDESKKIRDNFKQNLSKWSIPLYSNWKIQNTIEGLGKMLVVTSSNYPGLLKGAFGWYDYVLSFTAMIPNSSSSESNVLGIFIRAKDGSNGIMLQFGESSFTPYYFFEGNFIVDNNQQTSLQTNLPLGDWVKFSIAVKGDDVQISFLSMKIHFNIKGYNFSFVPKHLLYQTPITTIGEIAQLSKENQDEFSNYLAAYRKKEDIKNNPNSTTEQISAEEARFELIQKKWSNKSLTTQGINLEYNQGSVGFREYGSEIVYVRDVVLKRID